MDGNLFNFRIVLESAAKLHGGLDGAPTLLASHLLGAIRHCFRSVLSIEPEAFDEEQLFGTADRRGKIAVVEMRFEGATEQGTIAGLDRLAGGGQGTLFHEVLVPAGAMLLGAVWVDKTLTPRHLTLLKSAVAGLELFGIGIHTNRGYGACRLEFVDLQEVGRVFLSYTWENEAHNEWVLRLADRLTKEGISVIFDRYDLQIGSNIHVFMEKALDRATKVLLILTPTYKDKATARIGGVGFEFSLITSELFETLATNKKFIPVLRRGDRSSSIPRVLWPYAYCDMTADQLFERRFTELYGAILEKASVSRPRSRFGSADG